MDDVEVERERDETVAALKVPSHLVAEDIKVIGADDTHKSQYQPDASVIATANGNVLYLHEENKEAPEDDDSDELIKVDSNGTSIHYLDGNSSFQSNGSSLIIRRVGSA